MTEIKAPLDRWCSYYFRVVAGKVEGEVYCKPDEYVAPDAAWHCGQGASKGGKWVWIGLWQGPSGLWYVYKDHAGWLATIEKDMGGSDASEVIDCDDI